MICFLIFYISKLKIKSYDTGIELITRVNDSLIIQFTNELSSIKLKLSKISEDILFNTLFTSAYPPRANLNSNEFVSFVNCGKEVLKLLLLVCGKK